MSSPTFADIDGDGDLDAFAGNNLGNTLFFRNTGTTTSPAFPVPATANPFGLTDVGLNATPAFADIDGDGDLDAFVGNRNGDMLFYRNNGNVSSPVFVNTATNPLNRYFDAGLNAAPTFAEIHGDGDLARVCWQQLWQQIILLQYCTVSSSIFH